MKKIIATAVLLGSIGILSYLITILLINSWAKNGVIGVISNLIALGLSFCFAFFLHKMILWSVDNLDEPKVDTSSFRNDEIQALKKIEYVKNLKRKEEDSKEPLTFEQWRDKYFIPHPFVNTDSPKDVHWISRKTSQAVFSEDVLMENYEFWKMCL